MHCVYARVRVSGLLPHVGRLLGNAMEGMRYCRLFLTSAHNTVLMFRATNTNAQKTD